MGNDPVNATDPTGEALWFIAACALNAGCRAAVAGAVGAAAGAAGELYNQTTDGKEGINWNRVGVSGLKGGAVGAVGGATLNPNAAIATAATLGAADGAYVAANDDDPNTTIAGGAVTGALVDGAATALGGGAGKIAGKLIPNKVILRRGGRVVKEVDITGEVVGNVAAIPSTRAVAQGANVTGRAMGSISNKIQNTMGTAPAALKEMVDEFTDPENYNTGPPRPVD